MRERVKNEHYRPIVTVDKAKKGVPTVVEISGKRYTLSHPDHKRGNQEIRRQAE
ncbi:hypothetical protein J2S78_002087 [Salibacterium salarium]|uniref:hypothetical protein n=1 Tax=Salibacterium salarium TaxID=284579 RepID=UPI0027826CC9|nr:hypothetical protein [Salibacterium salarium]MDQ0299667.1 hypothetical protein [Salibacterium salarium]